MDKISSDLLAFFQKNTLWQFFSRTWDREENINGMFGSLETLAKKESLPRETPLEKTFYADATVMFQQLGEKVEGFSALSPEEAVAALEAAKAELVDIVITKSKNEELSAELY